MEAINKSQNPSYTPTMYRLYELLVVGKSPLKTEFKPANLEAIKKNHQRYTEMIKFHASSLA